MAEMEHQRDKYSDDEIDQARKNLREDKANLKTQEDIIDNVRRWYFEVIKKEFREKTLWKCAKTKRNNLKSTLVSNVMIWT